MRGRNLAFCVGAVLALTMVVVPVASATSSDFGHFSRPTQCNGTIATDVRGDVVVPAETTCALGPITVYGSVHVGPGAELDTQGTNVFGEIDTAPGGSSSRLTCGSINVSLVVGSVLCLEAGSTVRGDVECGGPYCEVNASTVAGDEIAASTSTRIVANGATIGRDVGCVKCVAADLFDSTVSGNVSSAAQSDGGLICGNTISGSVLFTGNKQFFDTCSGNTIGGNLVVDGNDVTTGYMSIAGNQIGGSLDVSFDTGPVDISANTVRGFIACRFDHPQPTGTANTARWIDPACGPIGPPLP